MVAKFGQFSCYLFSSVDFQQESRTTKVLHQFDVGTINNRARNGQAWEVSGRTIFFFGRRLIRIRINVTCDWKWWEAVECFLVYLFIHQRELSWKLRYSANFVFFYLFLDPSVAYNVFLLFFFVLTSILLILVKKKYINFGGTKLKKRNLPSGRDSKYWSCKITLLKKLTRNCRATIFTYFFILIETFFRTLF